MSNDQKFGRNARAWLELGPTDAPDRVIEAALLEIDQTSQERDFRVPWRLPIMSLATRSAAIAIVAVVALGVAVVFFRPPSPRVGSSSASPTATPVLSPSQVSMAEFKSARDAICKPAATSKAQLEPRYVKIFDTTATAAEQADGVVALNALVTLSSQVTDQLEALDTPANLVKAQATNIAQYRDILAILQHELQLLHAGKTAEAQAVDITTDSVSAQISSWEVQYGFIDCP